MICGPCYKAVFEERLEMLNKVWPFLDSYIMAVIALSATGVKEILVRK